MSDRLLLDAIRAMGEAQNSVAQAFPESTGQSCSILIERAMGQLTHALENLSRASACNKLPPALQPYTLPRHRGYRLTFPGLP